MDPKPLKRSKELVPLSKDHHEGLLLVWKVRQGLKNGTNAETIAAYIRWFWYHHLQEHFREEEEILAPALPPQNEMVKQMFTEHEQIVSIVNSERLSDAEQLTTFATLLNDHIRFEERALFPFAEACLSPDDLKRIGEEFSKDVPACEKWPDEFWLRK